MEYFSYEAQTTEATGVWRTASNIFAQNAFRCAIDTNDIEPASIVQGPDSITMATLSSTVGDNGQELTLQRYLDPSSNNDTIVMRSIGETNNPILYTLRRDLEDASSRAYIHGRVAAATLHNLQQQLASAAWQDTSGTIGVRLNPKTF
ncbi:hypothetical protein EYC59_01195 [Candidatus Saccharibacteria bacterium]|nr:MAG: hypothetical protein EYC59_01195 [Candidatus Saccharibacteria bacterium]